MCYNESSVLLQTDKHKIKAYKTYRRMVVCHMFGGSIFQLCFVEHLQNDIPFLDSLEVCIHYTMHSQNHHSCHMDMLFVDNAVD